MVLRIPGRGLPSAATGGAAGDLLVVVHGAPDPRFERHGADLVRTETITVAEAALGVKRTVPTLDGGVEVTVPHGTQPGAVLRLHGKGVPAPGGQRRGDLYLRIDVRVPPRLSRRAQELYESLLALEAKPDAS
jgi:molecular chaperone DnaJ